MKSFSSLLAIYRAVASIVSSDVSQLPPPRIIRRAESEALESRRYLIHYDADGSSVGELFEGHVEFSLHAVEVNQYLGNDIHVNYGDGSNEDYFPGSTSSDEIIANISHDFADQATITAEFRQEHNQYIMGVEETHYFDVLNVQPTASLSMNINSGAGSYTVALSSAFDPSSADTTAGFTYSYSDTYAGLDDPGNWTSNPSRLSSIEDEDGVFWARIYDKDSGFSDYNTGYYLPTINIPGNLVTSGSVTLNWIDIASGESSWIIQRAPEGGSFATIHTLSGHAGSGGAMSYTDDTVQPDTRYIYRLRAAGNGADTAYAAKTYVRTALSVPTDVYASNISTTGGNAVQVNWTFPETEEVGYFLIKCYNPNGSYRDQIWTSNGTARSASFGTGYGLDAADEYAFTVSAMGDSEEGSHDSGSSDMVVNFDEPTGPWNPISVLDDNGGEWEGDAVWYGESIMNGKLTLTFRAPKHHTYLSGSYTFSMEEYAPYASFTATMGGDTLKTSHRASPSGRPGPAGGLDLDGYYTFYFAKPGDDAIKSTSKTVTVTIEMHGLTEYSPGEPYPELWHHNWRYDSDNATSYYPFVAIAPNGSFAEGSTNAKFDLTRFQVTLANRTISSIPLEVTFQDLGGTAVKGTDYGMASQGSIPGGLLSKDVPVSIINNSTPEWTKDFNVHGVGKSCKVYGASYFEQAITDDDLHIDPLPETIEIGDHYDLHLDYADNGPPGSTVELIVPRGIVFLGRETPMNGTIVLDVGEHDVEVRVVAPSEFVGDMAIFLAASDSFARPGKPSTDLLVSTGISTVRPEVWVQAGADATEGGAFSFSVHRRGLVSTTLEVQLTSAGTALPDLEEPNPDYEALPDSITFQPGSSSASFTRNSIQDSEVEFSETVILKLLPDSAGHFKIKMPPLSQPWRYTSDSARIYIDDDEVGSLAGQVYGPGLAMNTLQKDNTAAAAGSPDNCQSWAFNLTASYRPLRLDSMAIPFTVQHGIFASDDGIDLDVVLYDKAMMKRVLEAMLYDSGSPIRGYRSYFNTPVPFTGWHMITAYWRTGIWSPVLGNDFHYATHDFDPVAGTWDWSDKENDAKVVSTDPWFDEAGEMLSHYLINTPPRNAAARP